MAIKGKTKRSQGRPVRRPATGPRVHTVERRQPWYRATAFPVTLAVIALIVTLVAAFNRAQHGWARDDTRRFTTALRVETDKLNRLLGPGTKQAPGMGTAGDLAGGNVKAKDYQVRASGWVASVDQIRQRVANLTVGEPEQVTEFNGVPVNNVGGHVPLLTSVRDAYTTAIGFYGQAATTYQRAAEAPKGDLQQKLMQQAQAESAKGAEGMDAAASFLARIMAGNGLDVNQQLPGESSGGYANRTGASQVPGGAGLPPGAGGQPGLPGQPGGQPGLPGQPGGQPGLPPAPPPSQ